MLNNIGDKFGDYDFNGAEIRPYVGLGNYLQTIEWMAKGVFAVDESVVTNQ